MSGYDIYQCSNCYTATVENMPSDEELQKFYSGFKYKINKNYIKKYESEIFRKWFLSFGFKDGAKMLDLGGGGYFSYAFQKFNIGESYYIDLDDEACQFPSKELNIKNVINGDARDLGRIFNHKFDFIYSRHLIEHLKNPTELIDAAINQLAPSGVLLPQFPNGRSLEYFGYMNLLQHRIKVICDSNNFSKAKTLIKLFGPKMAHGIDPIRHLWAISPKGISEYLQKKGVKFVLKTAPLSDPIYSPHFKVKNQIITKIINNTLVKIHGGTHLMAFIYN